MIGRTFTIYLLMVMMSAVNAYPGGRKILQVSRGSTFSGGAVAAINRAEANIQQVASAPNQVRPGQTRTPPVEPALPRVGNPNPKITSRGTATAGRQEDQQARAGAIITSQASGNMAMTPKTNPPLEAPDMPRLVQNMPKGSSTVNTGRSTTMQSFTTAGIEATVAQQEAIAAKNARPGPNVAGPRMSRPGEPGPTMPGAVMKVTNDP